MTCPHPSPALLAVRTALWCMDCGSLYEPRVAAWLAPGSRVAVRRQWTRGNVGRRKAEPPRRTQRRARKAVGV
jgi:hypothetical protein